MKYDGALRFVSIDEFAQFTGICLADVRTLYTVEVDGRLQVPRFMLDSDQDRSNDQGTESHWAIPHTILAANDTSLQEAYFTTGNDTGQSVEEWLDFEFFDTGEHTNTRLDDDSSTMMELLHQDAESNPVPTDQTNQTDNTESELDPIERVRNRLRQTHSHMHASAAERFLARMFDIVLFFSLPAYVLLLIGRSLDGTSTQLQPALIITALLVVCMISALLLDAFCYHFFGNTPGKALLNLRVSDSAGKPLTFRSYHFRNFSLLAQGLAFMIMPITLLTLWMQFSRVNSNQPTSYDAMRNNIVEEDSSGILRKLMFWVALLLSLSIAVNGGLRLFDSVFQLYMP